MRCVAIIPLLAFISLFTACSYGTAFVVVNDSKSPIEVRYRIKQSPNEPLVETDLPATIATSRLRDRNKQWQKLDAAQYQLDEGSRTVTARVMPDEALRVAIIWRYTDFEDSYQREHFPIEEITVVGAGGELKLMGEQARQTFVAESERLYTIIYK